MFLLSLLVRVTQCTPVSKDLDVGSWQKISAHHLSYKTFFIDLFFPSPLTYFSIFFPAVRKTLCVMLMREGRWIASCHHLSSYSGWAGDFLLILFLNLLVIQSELQVVIGTNVEIICLLMNIPQKVVYLQIRSLCYKVRALSLSHLGFIWRLSKE